MNTNRKRLIEVSLPLEAISAQSAREKSIRHGHISTLHIWWARRPLAAMRAAIFASLVPAPESDEEREALEKLIAAIVDWDQVKDGNSEAVLEARQRVLDAFDGLPAPRPAKFYVYAIECDNDSTYIGQTNDLKRRWQEHLGGKVGWTKRHKPVKIIHWEEYDSREEAVEREKKLKTGFGRKWLRREYEAGRTRQAGRPPRVLDPFMGGGATGLEALRLGCETHAVELNPVAHLIELCTLVYPQQYGQPEVRTVKQGALEVEQVVNPLAEDVRRWGEWVLERAREEIGHLYENPEGDETIVGYLWARTVRCPNPACGAEMPLVRQWWLAKTDRRKIALKPAVDRAAKQVTFEVVTGDALKGFDPAQGTSSRGHATCLVCNQVADVDYIRSEGEAGRMWQTPLVVISEQIGAGKDYRSLTDQDENLFQEALALLTQVGDHAPDESLPTVGTLGFRVQRYGITRWSDLFNARQLLAMLTFSRQVRAAQKAMLAQGIVSDRAQATATYLALALDRLSDFNSSLTRWVSQGEFIANTFGRQALPMIWDYTEVNPFSDSTGNWLGAMDWITRVIEHAAQASNKPAVTQQGTAIRLSYPNSYFDAVVTDPPYYDAVPYADLSDFFYVWLKRSVGFLYPDLFRTPLTPKTAEIIQHTAHHGGDEDAARAFYEQEMTRAFAEARRVLRPDGICVVVFAHKSTAAWETLLNSLLQAGLVVTASWPLHTEMASRARARGTASLASSIFIVCRVRPPFTSPPQAGGLRGGDGYFDDVQAELAATVRERLDFFWQQGIRGADFFISAIGPAVSVFGRYRQVYRLDGTPVGVGEMLDLVQETVADYALDRILNTSTALSAGSHRQVGYVDPATRYYILHRWAYSATKVPFDDAMRLAMALGAEVEALMDRRGLLKQSGETVTLLGPRERRDVRELGLPDRSGRPAPVIDVLHRAVTLWEKGDRIALVEFLAEAARGREEQVRVVAQTLADVLPEDDREKRLLEGFLAGQESLPPMALGGLPDAPRQERLF